jgi:hypothetical protein
MPQLSQFTMLDHASQDNPHEEKIELIQKNVPKLKRMSSKSQSSKHHHSGEHHSADESEYFEFESEFSLVLSNEHSWLRDQNIRFHITMSGQQQHKVEVVVPPPPPPQPSLSLLSSMNDNDIADGSSLASPSNNGSFSANESREKSSINSLPSDNSQGNILHLALPHNQLQQHKTLTIDNVHLNKNKKEGSGLENEDKVDEMLTLLTLKLSEKSHDLYSKFSLLIMEKTKQPLLAQLDLPNVDDVNSNRDSAATALRTTVVKTSKIAEAVELKNRMMIEAVERLLQDKELGDMLKGMVLYNASI